MPNDSVFAGFLRPALLLKKYWLFMAPALFCQIGSAQQNAEGFLKETLENYLRDNENATESDAQTLLENLETLLESPMDLNKADPGDFAPLFFLSELQVKNLLDYRQQFGGFQSVFELQAVPGLELADIRLLLPFVKISENNPPGKGLFFQNLKNGKNELLLRATFPPPKPESDDFEGGQNGLAVRFRHRFENKTQFGLTAEKDAGEAFFRGSNPNGFDFYSAHFFARDLNRKVKAIALGDFSARFGQGLVLQTGFSPGKTPQTMNVLRSGNRLSPYSAFGEHFFFRGAAATLGFSKKWEGTVLFSKRKRDANISQTAALPNEDPDIEFSALQTSGLHRTPAEIEDEKAIGETALGFSASRLLKTGRVSLNFLQLNFDKAWQPDASEPSRVFAFSGKKLSGGSLDYSFSKRNWLFFGETALSDNGKPAFSNGFVLVADPKLSFVLLHRHFDPAYQSVYSGPFAEKRGAANEQGVYLGFEAKPNKTWQFNGYADVWRHDWLRFLADGPSSGHEFLGRAQYSVRRKLTVWFLTKFEKQEENAAADLKTGLIENERLNLRFHSEFKISPSLEMASRVEWNFYRLENQDVTRGFMLFQEARFRKLGFPVSFSGRYVVFDALNAENRIYAFENDLFSALSVPSYSGKGTRFYLNSSWRVSRRLLLESRLSRTFLLKTSSESAVLGAVNEWKLQARVRF